MSVSSRVQTHWRICTRTSSSSEATSKVSCMTSQRQAKGKLSKQNYNVLSIKAKQREFNIWQMTKTVMGHLLLCLTLLANMKPMFSNALSFTDVAVHWSSLLFCLGPTLKSGDLVVSLHVEYSPLLGVLCWGSYPTPDLLSRSIVQLSSSSETSQMPISIFSSLHSYPSQSMSQVTCDVSL